MNDSITKPSAGQPDALRRRLTKGGLAAPVVLATLASKPVLGGDVPWNCTLSGQLSGNASGKTEASCSTLGKGRSTLAADPYYPETNTSKLSDLGVSNPFFIDGGALVNHTTSTPATIHQVLTLPTPSSFVSGLEYAQKAVVLLLNAIHNTDPSNYYPLTEGQAKGLYEAAVSGGSFTDTNPNFTWGQDKVQHYIDLLYH